MQFWQNQLNFAIFCATTGCGIDYENHIQAKDPLIRAVFRFHVYCQVKRLLFQIGIALPQEHS